MTVSVISRTSRVGRGRSRARIASRSSTKPACWSWAAERLTVTVSSSPSGRSRAARPRPARQASVEDPRAERQDRAVLLGQRDEVDRAERGRASGGASGRAPRRRSIRPVASVDDRLVVRLELAAAEARGPAPRSARGGRRSPRASSARRPRPGRLPGRLGACTSRRRRCAAARRPGSIPSRPTAMPMLAADRDLLALDRERDLRARRRSGSQRRARGSSVGARPRGGSRTRRRPGGPRGRRPGRTPRSRSATATSSRSPAAWPSVSLTILKSSRSRKRTTAHAGRRRALEQPLVDLLGEQRSGWRGRSAGRGRPGSAAAP